MERRDPRLAILFHRCPGSNRGVAAPPILPHNAPNEFHASNSKVDFGFHDALSFLQGVSGLCDEGVECQKDQATILTILLFLIISLMLIFIAFFFFREDKEEQVTPLCPQLVVKDSTLTFKIALDPTAEKLEVISNSDPRNVIAKVAMDWPDPFRPCASGIASTARLQNSAGMSLATVVARNVAVSGQALALCRSGCEIFGFVESDGPMRYHVRHRTGVHLLTLVGDFSTWHVDGVNPAGAVVFSAKKENGCVVGKVQQHVDAGLLICCVLAAHIHRVLHHPQHGEQPGPSPRSYISSTPLQLADAQEQAEQGERKLYDWVRVRQGESLPPCYIHSGHTKTDGDLYVGRDMQGDLGKVNLEKGKIDCVWCQGKSGNAEAEMLVIGAAGYAEWKPIKKGDEIPHDAVRSGSSVGSHGMFVARSSGECGKLDSHNGKAQSIWIHSAQIGQESGEILCIRDGTPHRFVSPHNLVVADSKPDSQTGSWASVDDMSAQNPSEIAPESGAVSGA